MVFKRTKKPPDDTIVEVSPYWYNRFMRNGEPVYANTKQKNKQTARDPEADHRKRLAKGDAGIPTGAIPTLTQFEDRFIKAIRIRSADKPRTIEYYEDQFKRLLEYAPPANAKLDRIDAAAIESFVQKTADKVSVATTNPGWPCRGGHSGWRRNGSS